jgi:4'-phosphopantetheinyl transferase
VAQLDGLRITWRRVAPEADRREVAWGLLRELAGDVAIANPCPFCGGPHGPVQLPGSPWRASVAYAGNLAVVGVIPVGAADSFGVDAEQGDAQSGDLRAWTRVEAALKADGRGIRVDPASVRVTEDGEGWTAAVPGPRDDGDRIYRGWDAAAPAGVVISVAARGSGRR